MSRSRKSSVLNWVSPTWTKDEVRVFLEVCSRHFLQPETLPKPGRRLSGHRIDNEKKWDEIKQEFDEKTGRTSNPMDLMNFWKKFSSKRGVATQRERMERCLKLLDQDDDGANAELEDISQATEADDSLNMSLTFDSKLCTSDRMDTSQNCLSPSQDVSSTNEFALNDFSLTHEDPSVANLADPDANGAALIYQQLMQQYEESRRRQEMMEEEHKLRIEVLKLKVMKLKRDIDMQT